jgi:hypothetical protein
LVEKREVNRDPRAMGEEEEVLQILRCALLTWRPCKQVRRLLFAAALAEEGNQPAHESDQGEGGADRWEPDGHKLLEPALADNRHRDEARGEEENPR